MIARIWKGTPREGHADDYLAHLRNAVVPELVRIPGFRGVEVLRHAVAPAEIVVITRWDSMDAITSFAGPNPDVAVVADGARRVLARWDDHVTHYEIVGTW